MQKNTQYVCVTLDVSKKYTRSFRKDLIPYGYTKYFSKILDKQVTGMYIVGIMQLLNQKIKCIKCGKDTMHCSVYFKDDPDETGDKLVIMELLCGNTECNCRYGQGIRLSKEELES